jgi:peptidoglycan/LPS O-acetylase OafA/YrhL
MVWSRIRLPLASTAAAPHAPKALARQNFESLEVLRGLAALYVVLNHARGFLWAGGESLQAAGTLATMNLFDRGWVVLNQLTRLGHEAVILFFVHSGFAIAYSLSRTRRVSGFYQRRAVRLYPTYLVGLAWAFLVLWMATRLVPEFFEGVYDFGVYAGFPEELDRFGPAAVLKNLLYIPTVPFIPQFWSLPHEVIFYLLAPLYLRRPRTYVGVSLALAAIGLLVDPHAPFALQHVFVYNGFFAVGVGLFLTWDRVSAAVDRVPRWAVLGGMAAGFLVCVVLSRRFGTPNRLTEWIAAGISVVALAKFARVEMKNRALLALGRWSYSLYVTHVATVVLVLCLFHVLTGWAPPIDTPWIWPLAVPFCLGVAYVAYWLVEARARRYLQQLRDRAGATAA